MSVILVDPHTRTISEVEIEDSLDGAYKAMECDMIQIVYLPSGDMLVLDEEGSFKPNPRWFIDGWGDRLLGKALIVGKSNDHLNKPPVLTLAQVKAKVTFT